jgi:antitoxin MazE
MPNMAIRQRIVRIGNSRGVRLPSSMLAEAHLAEGDEVEVSAEVGQIVLRPIKRPRAGWAERFAEMARQGDDALLDAEYLTPSEWDQTEWEW